MTRTGACTDCHLRPIDRSVIGPELCTVCLDYADWENVHQDNDGVDESHLNTCPICHPELDLRYTKKTGHTNTATKGPHHSHAACGHAKTPAQRAECRASHTWDGTAWVPNA